MSGIYGVLQIGARSLLAQQKGLEITGHNIANVNTPGYSRQKANLQTGMPMVTPQGIMGTGVNARESERVYDRFVGTQIQNENEELGRWDAQKTALERVEIIINESSDDGLSKTMGEFWNAWQDLVNNPSGNVERMALLGNSETLAFEFQNTYNNLSPLQHDLDLSITATVDEINLKAAEIADLNQRIIEAEGGGAQANDFRDARDLAVNDLSLMIDVDTYEDGNGSINVSLKSGGSLVNGSSSPDLSTMVGDMGHKDVVWASDPAVSINSTISGGKLKGWLEARDVIIPEYKGKMEDLVNGIKGVESTEVVTGAASTLSGGEYFTLSSPTTDYYVWYDIGDGSTGPTVVGSTGIEVDILSTDTAAQVASKTAAAIDGETGFDASVTGGAILTITNAVAGVATDSADSAVSGKETGFAITKRIDGRDDGLNSLHRSGFDRNGTAGGDFFSGTLAGNDFAVDAAIAADSNKIAASGTAAGAPGDNSNAIDIAELQNALMMNANTTTFDNYYNSMVSDVGNKVKQAGMSHEHHIAMASHLENYRESISGVSLDEEMISLVQFQLGYDAAAKLIGTTDEMLQTLINMV